MSFCSNVLAQNLSCVPWIHLLPTLCPPWSLLQPYSSACTLWEGQGVQSAQRALYVQWHVICISTLDAKNVASELIFYNITFLRCFRMFPMSCNSFKIANWIIQEKTKRRIDLVPTRLLHSGKMKKHFMFMPASMVDLTVLHDVILWPDPNIPGHGTADSLIKIQHVSSPVCIQSAWSKCKYSQCSTKLLPGQGETIKLTQACLSWQHQDTLGLLQMTLGAY